MTRDFCACGLRDLSAELVITSLDTGVVDMWVTRRYTELTPLTGEVHITVKLRSTHPIWLDDAFTVCAALINTRQPELYITATIWSTCAIDMLRLFRVADLTNLTNTYGAWRALASSVCASI